MGGLDPLVRSNIWPSYHYLRFLGQRRVIGCVGTHVIMTNTKNSKTQLMKHCQSIGLTNQRILWSKLRPLSMQLIQCSSRIFGTSTIGLLVIHLSRSEFNSNKRRAALNTMQVSAIWERSQNWKATNVGPQLQIVFTRDKGVEIELKEEAGDRIGSTSNRENIVGWLSGAILGPAPRHLGPNWLVSAEPRRAPQCRYSRNHRLAAQQRWPDCQHHVGKSLHRPTGPQDEYKFRLSTSDFHFLYVTSSTFSHAIMGLLAFLPQFPATYSWLSLAIFLIAAVSIYE
jgi:hypothetical protein